MAAPFGGRKLLIDNSAWDRAAHPSVRTAFEGAVEGGQILIAPPFALEMLYSAKDGAEFERILEELQEGFDSLTPNEETWRIALAAQRELALHNTAFQRRFSTTDLLTAALAHQYQVGVLHQDSDYDDILEHTALEFDSVWLDPDRLIDAAPSADKIASAQRKTFNKRLGALPADERKALLEQFIEQVHGRLAELEIDIPEALKPEKG